MTEIHIDAKLECADGPCGQCLTLIVDRETRQVTHLVLEDETLPDPPYQRLVPVEQVAEAERDLIRLGCTRDAGDTVYLKLDRQAIGQLPAIPVRRHHVRRGEQVPKLDLIAVAFDGLEDADRALEQVDRFRKKGTLRILNAAVLVKDAEGNVSVKDTRDIDPKKGRLLGAVTGGLIGLVGGPVGAVVGALAGAGAGGLAGKTIDLGFSEPLLDGLKQHLKPGTSALVVLVEHGYREPLSDVIAQEKSVFFQQTLTDKLVEQLLSESEEAAPVAGAAAPEVGR